MLISNKLRFYSTCFTLFFLIGNTSLIAQTQSLVNQPGEAVKESFLSYNIKRIELVQMEQEIKIMNTRSGKTVSIPQINKVLVDSTVLPTGALAYFDPTYYDSTHMRKVMDSRKEIAELSKELGIKIKNDEYLDLYKEIVYWIGTPYRYGSMSSKAVDCSGFTSLIYKAVYNTILPRTSSAMAKTYQVAKKEELEPGDLVFFALRGRKAINHVGIFIGDNKFIHASTSRGVIVDSLSDSYFGRAWRKSVKVDKE